MKNTVSVHITDNIKLRDLAIQNLFAIPQVLSERTWQELTQDNDEVKMARIQLANKLVAIERQKAQIVKNLTEGAWEYGPFDINIELSTDKIAIGYFKKNFTNFNTLVSALKTIAEQISASTGQTTITSISDTKVRNTVIKTIKDTVKNLNILIIPETRTTRYKEFITLLENDISQPAKKQLYQDELAVLKNNNLGWVRYLWAWLIAYGIDKTDKIDEFAKLITKLQPTVIKKATGANVATPSATKQLLKNVLDELDLDQLLQDIGSQLLFYTNLLIVVGGKRGQGILDSLIKTADTYDKFAGMLDTIKDRAIDELQKQLLPSANDIKALVNKLVDFIKTTISAVTRTTEEDVGNIETGETDVSWENPFGKLLESPKNKTPAGLQRMLNKYFQLAQNKTKIKFKLLDISIADDKGKKIPQQIIGAAEAGKKPTPPSPPSSSTTSQTPSSAPTVGAGPTPTTPQLVPVKRFDLGEMRNGNVHIVIQASGVDIAKTGDEDKEYGIIGKGSVKNFTQVIKDATEVFHYLVKQWVAKSGAAEAAQSTEAQGVTLAASIVQEMLQKKDWARIATAIGSSIAKVYGLDFAKAAEALKDLKAATPRQFGGKTTV